MSVSTNDPSEKHGISNDIFVVFSWVQEHANLCTVASLCPKESESTYEALRLAIGRSLERGTRLLEGVMNSGEGFPHTPQHGGAASDAHPVAMPPRSYVPLSGSHRFDESLGGRVRLVKPPAPVAAASESHDLVPSRNYSKGKSDPKKVS